MKKDFDYLKQLYISDKEEFKRVTDDMMNDAINKAPEDKQKRLRIKQWHLEQELGKIKNPIERMNRMVGIFWSGTDKFIKTVRNTNDQIQNVVNEQQPPIDDNEINDTNVVSLTKKKED